jgi:hypothetical protein
MNRWSWKAIIAINCGVLMIAGIVLLTCGPTSPTPTPSTPLNELTITSNEFPGWGNDTILMDTTHYIGSTAFTDTMIHDFVDGGNTDYCGACNGHGSLKSGLATYFKYPDSGYKLFSLVIDYGTASAANAEFNVWINKKTGQTQVPIPSFSNTTAVGYEGNGGVTAYAHFSNYYIELQFSNYNGLTDLAVADAKIFLAYFQSKIK